MNTDGPNVTEHNTRPQAGGQPLPRPPAAVLSNVFGGFVLVFVGIVAGLCLAVASLFSRRLRVAINEICEMEREQ